jgi:hypothetical protein
MSLCLESAQCHNLHQIQMEFFYPKQPWKSLTDYKNKEKKYDNENQKALMLSEFVNQADDRMIELKVANGEKLYLHKLKRKRCFSLSRSTR